MLQLLIVPLVNEAIVLIAEVPLLRMHNVPRLPLRGRLVNEMLFFAEGRVGADKLGQLFPTLIIGYLMRLLLKIYRG